jgi:signal transduction histidine kinase
MGVIAVVGECSEIARYIAEIPIVSLEGIDDFKVAVLENEFDVVFVTDKCKGGGIEVVRFMREMGHLSPVIAVMDSRDIGIAREYLRASVFEILLSPLSPEVVKDSVKRAYDHLRAMEFKRRELLRCCVKIKELEREKEMLDLEFALLKKKLVKRDECIKKMLEGYCSGIVLVDDDGQVVDVDPHFLRISTMEKEDVIGKYLNDIFSSTTEINLDEILKREKVEADLRGIPVEIEICMAEDSIILVVNPLHP